MSSFTSPESWWSVQIQPNRLQQVSWTNPFTNNILFEAGLSATPQLYDSTRHRQYDNPRTIPRVIEFGNTAGGDTGPGPLTPVNTFAGQFCAPFQVPRGCAFALTSGSLNTALGGSASRSASSTSTGTRASVSYVTGTHNAKIGYDGGYFTQATTNMVNDPRLTYHYATPPATCVAHQYAAATRASSSPTDPSNTRCARCPRYVEINTGSATIEDRVLYSAFYVQDQWTLKRFTLSGAHPLRPCDERLRRDVHRRRRSVRAAPVRRRSRGQRSCVHAESTASPTTTSRRGGAWRGTCSAPARRRSSGTWASICRPRGSTASTPTPTRRSARSTSLTRTWTDVDGDRIVDCDLLNFNAQGECAGGCLPAGC